METVFDEMKAKIIPHSNKRVGFTSIRQLYDFIIIHGTGKIMDWQTGLRHGMSPLVFADNLRLLTITHWGNVTLSGLVTELISRHMESRKNIIDELVIMGGQPAINGIAPANFSKTLFIIVDHFFTIE